MANHDDASDRAAAVPGAPPLDEAMRRALEREPLVVRFLREPSRVRWLPLGAGAIFLGIGLLLAFNTARFVRRAQTVVGHVASIGSRLSGDEMTYYPVIEYQASDGNTYSYNGELSSKHEQDVASGAVTVLYDPREPSRGRSAGFFSLWIGSLVFSVLGALALLAGWHIGRPD